MQQRRMPEARATFYAPTNSFRASKLPIFILKQLPCFYTLLLCVSVYNYHNFISEEGDERDCEQNKIMFTHVSVIVDVISKVSSNCSVLQNQLSSSQPFV